jgi:hypothetical protein
VSIFFPGIRYAGCALAARNLCTDVQVFVVKYIIPPPELDAKVSGSPWAGQPSSWQAAWYPGRFCAIGFRARGRDGLTRQKTIIN